MGRSTKNRTTDYSKSKKEIIASFFSSFIVHVIFLLILSMIILTDVSVERNHIVLAFSTTFQEEVVEYAEINIEESENSFIPEETPIEIKEIDSISIDIEDSYFQLENIAEIVPDEAIKDMPIETQSSKKTVSKPPNGPPAVSKKPATSTSQISTNKAVDIDRKLSEVNAQTGQVQISLSWDNINDIDLWVEYNGFCRDRLGWQNVIGISGGFLDVDANAVYTTTRPIENIFWKTAPAGTYTVYAHFYRQWDRTNNTPIIVRILINGQIIYKSYNMDFRNPNPVQIFSFTL